MKGLQDSFKAAFRGFWRTLVFERTFKIMMSAAVLVTGAMFYLPTSRLEKIGLLTMIFAVLGLELVNSTIEKFLDFIKPEPSEKVRVIKDLMAAIVLLASLGAAVIGLIVFLPYF